MSDDCSHNFRSLPAKELLEKSLEHTMDMVRFMKTEMCKDNNGQADLNPFCVFGIEITDDEGEQRLGGAVIEMELEKHQHPVQMLPKMLSEIHENGMEKFHWVMFVCEGYAEMDTEKVKAMLDGEHEPNYLEKDFLNNPSTTVQEGLIASCFGWNGESACDQQPYTYDDKGIPVFGEKIHTYSEEELKGRIPDIFTRFIKYCQLVELTKNN